jgi:hypothetical protein
MTDAKGSGTKDGPPRSLRDVYAPLLEALGLAELEHQPRNNRMRAL